MFSKAWIHLSRTQNIYLPVGPDSSHVDIEQGRPRGDSPDKKGSLRRLVKDVGSDRSGHYSENVEENVEPSR